MTQSLIKRIIAFPLVLVLYIAKAVYASLYFLVDGRYTENFIDEVNIHGIKGRYFKVYKAKGRYFKGEEVEIIN
jgi:hypothetical protein